MCSEFSPRVVPWHGQGMSVAFPDGLVGDYAYVAIDTETTGLNVTDRPLEIAGVRIEGGQITGRERLKMKLQSAAMKGLAMKEMGQDV